jgi:hypothetical protein
MERAAVSLVITLVRRLSRGVEPQHQAHASGDRSQTLERSPHPVSFRYKSNFPSEPLPERLKSLEISRALWLVKFPG